MTRSSSTFQLACGSSGDVQSFVLEKALFLGDRDRRHVGQLDEAELEIFLLGLERGPSAMLGAKMRSPAVCPREPPCSRSPSKIRVD